MVKAARAACIVARMRSVILLVVLLAACRGGHPHDAGPMPDTGPPPDAGPFVLPPAPEACTSFASRGPQSITVGSALDVAAAAAPTELAVAFVDRGAGDALSLRVQRLTPTGARMGSPVEVAPIGTGTAGGAAIATDGSVYVACGGGMPAGIVCGSVPVGGGIARRGASIPGGTDPSLAFGAGGFVLAYLESGGIRVQALDASAARVGVPRSIATGTGSPSIAPTDDGYAIGYAKDAAYVQLLDDGGAPAGPALSLGTSRAQTRVAVTFATGDFGAAWIDGSGVAVASFGRRTPVNFGGPDASFGRVAIAPAQNGVVASFSSFAGVLGVAAIGTSGVSLGPTVTVPVGWNDTPHAIAAGPAGFVVVAAAGSSLSPLETWLLSCP